jgi:hypothetical protein
MSEMVTDIANKKLQELNTNVVIVNEMVRNNY